MIAKGTVTKVLRIGAGSALICVGVLGLAVPIVPGWVLIFLGIVMVAPGSRLGKWVKRMIVALRSKVSWRKKHNTQGGAPK